ncbi:MAG: N-acetyl sugar amidotransferase [Fimbriimonadaceae bacterium]|nr:N-acetyl sugar amidotransferase [Fimbriimonadaceae bacterium]
MIKEPSLHETHASPDHFRAQNHWPLPRTSPFYNDRPYQMCSQCVMDTSDPGIRFDDKGVCNHCHQQKKILAMRIKAGAEAERALSSLVDRVKASAKGRDYDCIIGVSGGVDSSYTAYAVKEKLGLNPLAVHLDNGWNTVEAVHNIRNMLDLLKIDLHTEVLDWEEFRDLQLSFLKASTPDAEIPSDHAILALMVKMAKKFGLKYILTGVNAQSEGMVPLLWSQGHKDWKYIKSVQRIFGSVPLKTFPHYSFWDDVYTTRLNKIYRQPLLDWLDYDKEAAKRFMIEHYGWREYGQKHGESIYTRFFQQYILIEKFGFDKRRGHLSALIVSGQLSREDALAELEHDFYPKEKKEQDRLFTIKKLGITEEEFDEIMRRPPKSIHDYPSYETTWWYRMIRSQSKTRRPQA